MKPVKTAILNTLWGKLIIEELIRNGVDYFCIAPGSRSTPLTAAIAQNKKAKSFLHFDERGLAFHALGYVSATRKPAALICTSGTAVGNFFPAIIEASKKKLPLIVLTADRPPELQKSGSDQTIDQSGIFGKYAKWEFQFPCPAADISSKFVLTTIDQAVYQAKDQTPGVVHLNCMYREPLAPIRDEKLFVPYLKGLGSWAKGQKPYTTYVEPKISVNAANPLVLETLSKIKIGLMVAGRLSTNEEKEAVIRLSEKLQFPIFPDVTSGLRLGGEHQNLIPYYDQLLLSKKLTKDFQPDGVLHLGGRMCSKRYYQFINKIKPKNYITVLPHPLRNDPLHAVTFRVQSPILDFCRHISQNSQARHQNPWIGRLKKLSQKAEQIIDKQKSLSEITVPRLISHLIPKDSGLFLASSMPIRDMDMYGAHNGNSVTVGSNRGASGIDGTIATAAGFARGLDKPTTLIVGDLAFLHDLNSLAMVKNFNAPFVMVVLNNNGGGIFNFLSIAERRDIFEKYFAAAHGLNFRHTAEMFGINYAAAASVKAFLENYQRAVKTPRAAILEIQTNREENFAVHRALQKKIISKMDG